MADKELWEAGLKLRTQVLGDSYVGHSMETDPEFMRPFQDMTNEFAYGSVWNRPQMSLRMRSLVTLALLSTLARPNYLRVHLEGALRNGCTKDEIREVFLHTFVYCGGPPAQDALRLALEVFAAHDAKQASANATTASKVSS